MHCLKLKQQLTEHVKSAQILKLAALQLMHFQKQKQLVKMARCKQTLMEHGQMHCLRLMRLLRLEQQMLRLMRLLELVMLGQRMRLKLMKMLEQQKQTLKRGLAILQQLIQKHCQRQQLMEHVVRTKLMLKRVRRMRCQKQQLMEHVLLMLKLEQLMLDVKEHVQQKQMHYQRQQRLMHLQMRTLVQMKLERQKH